MRSRNSSNSFRIGWGEMVSPEGMRSAVRCAFLQTLDKIEPHCLRDLRAVFDKLREAVAAALGSDLRLSAGWPHPLVVEWARRYNLTDGKEPAPWVLDVAALTLRKWYLLSLLPGWVGTENVGWAYPSFTPSYSEFRTVLIEEHERRIGGKYRFNPEMERRDDARRRIPARYHAEIDRILNLARERGGVESEWKCEPEHFKWLVRYFVGENGKRYSEAELAQRPGALASPFAVHKAIGNLNALLGLSRQKGRPRKGLT